MKGKIVKNFPLLPPVGYSAIVLFPFIFVDTNSNKWRLKYLRERLLNHEGIHFYQQLETLVIPFFVIYIIEFIIKLLWYRRWDVAYRNVSFEREAFSNENNINYLDNRKWFSWIKYFYKKK